MELPASFPPLPKPRSGNFIDLTGQRFERLTVVGFAASDGKTTYWWCRCDCGTITKPAAIKLRQGKTKSCGCHRRDMIQAASTTHGLTRAHPLYGVWTKMRSRCLHPSDAAFEDYGGRGIRICQRWIAGDGDQTGFECFALDMGAKPSPEHTLDRLHNDGHYCPQNCRWATKSEQARNRRSNRIVDLDGERVSLAEACDRLGLLDRYFTINSRMQRGMTFAEARAA